MLLPAWVPSAARLQPAWSQSIHCPAVPSATPAQLHAATCTTSVGCRRAAGPLGGCGNLPACQRGLSPPAACRSRAPRAVTLNANRHVTGTLRGFDQFMNVVLDNTVDTKNKMDIGMVVSGPQLLRLLCARACVVGAWGGGGVARPGDCSRRAQAWPPWASPSPLCCPAHAR